jgi:hypothetical protein
MCVCVCVFGARFIVINAFYLFLCIVQPDSVLLCLFLFSGRLNKDPEPALPVPEDASDLQNAKQSIASLQSLLHQARKSVFLCESYFSRNVLLQHNRVTPVSLSYGLRLNIF